MIRYRWFWSAAVIVLASANCAVAQPTPVAPLPRLDTAAERPDVVAQPAPYVIYNTDDLAEWADQAERPARARAVLAHENREHFIEELRLRPQPAVSRKAIIVFTANDYDDAEPQPHLSRALQLIIGQ